MSGGRFGTPLFQACLAGNWIMFESMVKHSPHFDSAVEPNGLNLLHAACIGESERIVQWLLNNSSILVDSQTRITHETPILFACGSGTKMVVELLLAKGAELTWKDNLGHSALLHAVNGISATMMSVIKMLLANGVDVDEASNDGITALMAASAQGNVKAVKYLLAKGADPSVRTKTQKATALHYATFKGRHNVVEILLEDGRVPINMADDDGRTPLHWALYTNKR